jgi:hypothetical protein
MLCVCLCTCLQEPSLLKLLYDKVAAQHDIFFINFGRWHFNNCAGLQLDTYRRSLRQLAAFYKVQYVLILQYVSTRYSMF